MYMSALGKYVNIPYGNLWNPCETMRNLNTSASNCLTSGVQTDHIYNSVSEFKVNQDFPQVIQILFIFLIVNHFYGFQLKGIGYYGQNIIQEKA